MAATSVPANVEHVLSFFSILTQKENKLYSPVLKMKDNLDRTRTWQIILELNSSDKITESALKMLRKESKIEAKYYTISGVEGGNLITSAEKTPKCKNIGSKNETTSLTQAILDARSLFNDKKKGGYVENINEINITRPFPMALHNVEQKKNWAKLRYPLYIQPKYDGTLFIQHVTTGSNIDAYSRGRESYVGQEHTLVKLSDMKRFPYKDFFLIGELWKEGHSLQDISGATRQQFLPDVSGKDADVSKLEYWVFDIATYPSSSNTPSNTSLSSTEKIGSIWSKYSDRLAILDKFFECNTNHYIKKVPTFLVKDKAEATAYYEKFLNQKLEGAVLRMSDAPYEWGDFGEKRVYHTMKWKPRFDEEYSVQDFKEGAKGKEVGAIIFIFSTSLSSNTTEKEKKVFSATPNWPYDMRQYAYSLLQSDKELWDKLRGQLMTIQFSIKSTDGVPQQPKVIRFREQKYMDLLFKDFKSS